MRISWLRQSNALDKSVTKVPKILLYLGQPIFPIFPALLKETAECKILSETHIYI